jgi:hypothetical protein
MTVTGRCYASRLIWNSWLLLLDPRWWCDDMGRLGLPVFPLFVSSFRGVGRETRDNGRGDFNNEYAIDLNS